MARFAVVNKENKVVNVCEWEGAEWLPPKGHYVVRHDKCDIGDTYDAENHVFIKPAPQQQPIIEAMEMAPLSQEPTMMDMMQLIKDLQAEVNALKGNNP